MTNNTNTESKNLQDALLVAGDAMLEGRKAAALNILLAEGMTLHDALWHLTPERTPVVGDILVSSWGYDQTNIDYYQVVKVTAKSVRLRKIGKRVIERADHTRGSTSDEVVPAVGAFDADEKTITRRFSLSSSPGDFGHFKTYTCGISSYSCASLWDGQPDYETGWAYGH